MAYWLIKSEPGTYSIDDMQKEQTTYWNGVRNYQARNNLKAMKEGDICLFYHSVTDPAVVGIVVVTKEHYQDPTTDETAWVVVDVTFKEKLKNPVSLAAIKANPELADMVLLRSSRLSVQPVEKEEYKVIMQMAGKK